MMERFECNDVGELSKYIGCKVDKHKDSIKLTQPVLLQSFKDKFQVTETKAPMTPANPGEV